jgi:hypothetical protein
MAKKHNLNRELHLVCVKNKCMFKDCPCPKEDWFNEDHRWILGNEAEIKQFMETGVEVDICAILRGV